MEVEGGGEEEEEEEEENEGGWRLDGLQSRSGVGGEEKVFAPFKNGTRSPNPVLGLVTVVSEITQIQLFKSEIYFFRVYRLVLERKKTINFVTSVCIS